MSTELNDMKIKVPVQNAPTKDIRTGALMTDKGIATYPIGDTPTTRQFEGSQSTNTLEEWMSGKRAPARPKGNSIPGSRP